MKAVLSLLVLPLASCGRPSPEPVQTPFIRTVYQYPLGTWVENIAVRSNGDLLLTLATAPHLDQLDPFKTNATPTTVHDFASEPPSTGLFGIGEIDDDVFAVLTGNFSLDAGAVPGSWSVWEVDLSGRGDAAAAAADVRKISSIPEAAFLNGLSALPATQAPRDILAGDIGRGLVYRVSPQTGRYEVAIDNALTAKGSDPVFGSVGVNGIHVRGDELYLVNSGHGAFGKIPIGADGAPTGPGSFIAHVQNSSLEYDDFAIRGEHAYLVTGSGNSIEQVSLEGASKSRFIAGSLNSTQFAEPVSCAFGRTQEDSDVLYVVTAGGLAAPVDGDIRVGGQVIAVDTRQWEHWSEKL